MQLRRSLVFSFVDRYSGLLINVAASTLLARLLTPDEVGVFSIVMVLLALANSLRDMGAGQYLLQERELTDDRIRAVWAIQLGIGLALSAAVAAASKPMAAFYNDTRVADVMLVVAANYFLNPFGSITHAWLMRDMRFDKLAVIRFASSVVGASTSIALAWQGSGPLSLAWGSLAGTAATALVSSCFRPRGYPWLPGTKEIRRVLAFGTKITSTSIVQTLAQGAPEFFLAKAQGMAASGLYSRANGLVSMFYRLVMDAALSVATSMFASKARSDLDLSEPFVRAIGYITALGWSFAAVIAILAFPTIRVLYGAQWGDAVVVAQLLALALALGLPVRLCHTALFGAGRVNAILKLTVTCAAVTIVAAALASLHGLHAMGWAVAGSSALASGAWLAVTRRALGFRWRHLLQTAVRSVMVAIAAGIAPALTMLAYGPRPTGVMAAWCLVLGGVGAGAGMLVCAWAIQHPIFDELMVLLRRSIDKLKARRPTDAGA